MNSSFEKPLLDAYRTHSLALFIGSGLSLGRDVKGNFPTWSQLPHRLLDACERLGSLDEEDIQARRRLFNGRKRLEVMLADLGSLRTALDRDYQKALNDVFRPPDAVPGSAHQAVARLGVRAIVTTNYDPLIERLQEAQHRQSYTWKESAQALNDLESGRNVLLKVHGTAERHDTVVMTEREYHEVRSNSSYRAVLGHLLQKYSFLFIGYGMNDPLDLDLVLKWNADVFNSAARRHYALLKDPSDTERDRYEREYNVRVIPYSDHAQLPALLEELQRAASTEPDGSIQKPPQQGAPVPISNRPEPLSSVPGFPPPRAHMAPTRASLRKLLRVVLPESGSFDAFCLDSFEDVHLQFSGSMSRVAKENQLLLMKSPAVILARLREAEPGRVAENEGVIEYE